MRAQLVHITVWLFSALLSVIGSGGPAFAATSATGTARTDRVEAVSCCGDACSCGESCPCARSHDDAPEPDAPVTPSTDNRTTRLTLPLCASPLPNLHVLEPARDLAAHTQHTMITARVSGRELLACISRWTT